VKPVTVTTIVSKPVEEVYDHLDVLAIHEAFVAHLFTGWSFSGPSRIVQAARLEALFGPLTRAFARRANAKSMHRLAKLLEANTGSA
jgi:hypothetical protein